MSKINSLYVEICVFKRLKGKIFYLILKRSNKNKIFPGVYQIITGTVEKRHKNKRLETAVETVIREVYEETKLRPIRLWVLPFINMYYVVKKDTINLSPMFAAEVASDSEPIISNEHQTYKWVGYKSAKKYLIWESHRSALKYLNDFLIGKEDWGKFLQIKLKNKFK
ncbi:MAG: NUDIX hydrolase [Ignavibacteriae bacterium]|nr:MAG: NUDIX hydrolase [Ignavibacteriota bacterium]